VSGKPRLFVNPRQGQVKLSLEVKFAFDPTDPTMPVAGRADVTLRNEDPQNCPDASIVQLQVIETFVPGSALPGETDTRLAGEVDLHMMPTLLLAGSEYFKDRQDAIVAMGTMMKDVNERYVRVQGPRPRPGSPVERFALRENAIIEAMSALERDAPEEFQRIAARTVPRLVRQG
jgi:hypothetical protein